MTQVKNDLTARYDKRVVIIHWISFLLIAALVPTGKIMRETPVGLTKMVLYQYHFVIGILVFIMTLYRVYLFFTKPRPPLLETGLMLHNQVIVWVQRFFYIALLALGVSGLILVVTFNLGGAILQNDVKMLPITIGGEVFEVHEIVGNLLILVFFAHVGGVILHYFRHKENMLKRIFY
jgi:cytochrome b561